MRNFQLIRNRIAAILTISAILGGGQAYSQASFVQDARGESSIISQSGSGLVFNTSDAAVSFSFLRARRSFYWGVDTKFKAEEGISLLFKNGDIMPSGKVGAVFAWDLQSRKDQGILNSFYVSPAVTFSSVRLFDDKSTSFDDQFSEKQFTAPSLKLVFNRTGYTRKLASSGKTSSTVFGIAATVGTTDNLAGLTKLEVTTYTTIKDTDGQERRLETGKTTAFSPLSQYERNLAYAQINVDWLIIPEIFNKRGAVAVFSRSRFVHKMLPVHSPGLGLFLTKKGAPMDIVGGIVTQITDVFNVNDRSDGLKNRVVLSLVAGYPF